MYFALNPTVFLLRRFPQALVTWFYPGQPEVAFMLNCEGTVAEAVAAGDEGQVELVISSAAALLKRAL